MQIAALCCLAAAVYPENDLRIPGMQGGLIGFGLHLVRGAFAVFNLYLVWPITAIGLIITSREPSGPIWRSRLILPFLLWVAFYICRCFTSDIGPVGAEFRWKVLFFDQLPVLLPLFLIRMPGGATTVRNWFFWAGTFQVLASISSRLFLGNVGFPDLTSTQDVAIGQQGRLVIASDTITTAILLFQTALCGIMILMDKRTQRLNRLAAIVMIPLAIFLALATGSRGPIIAFIGALLLLLVLNRKRGIWFVSIFAGVGVAFVGAVAWLPLISNQADLRLNSFFADMGAQGATDESALTRRAYWKITLKSEPTAFGSGVASFGTRIGDPTDYPHNIFLEALYETGVLGLLGFTIIIVFYLAQWIIKTFKRPNPEFLFCTTGFTFYLIQNQFSGTFAGSAMWAVFLLLGVWTFALEPHRRAESVTLAQRANGNQKLIKTSEPSAS